MANNNAQILKATKRVIIANDDNVAVRIDSPREYKISLPKFEMRCQPHRMNGCGNNKSWKLGPVAEVPFLMGIDSPEWLWCEWVKETKQSGNQGAAGRANRRPEKLGAVTRKCRPNGQGKANQ